MLVLIGGLVLALLGTAQATTISRPPDLSATVTASVKPTRLPADGSAPVTLTVEGDATRRPDCLGDCPSLREIEVRLDPQIAVETEGLPTCKPTDIKGDSPSQARRKCGQALVGKGTTTETIQFVEVPPVTVSSEQLFFNAGGGRVLMYSYVPQTGSSGAGSVGTIRGLTFHPGGTAAAVSFSFTLGKTWCSKGERHSYLGGQCRTGVLKQPIRLTLSDGSTTSEAEPQRCTKRG